MAMISSDYSGYGRWKGWEDSSFGHCPPELSCYFRAELEKSGVASVHGKDVFEVGFGNGQFASWARSGGAAYRGSEVLGDSLRQGMAAGLDVFDAATSPAEALQESSLDLVVSFDVFEHMDAAALRGFLDAMFVALRPSGRMIARVPSGDSPFSRSIQHGDVTHRSCLGSSAIRQLAEAAGFQVASIREPAFPLAGLGVRTFVRRAVVTVVRRLAFPIISRVFMGGGSPVLTPNMVFVLVKP